MYTTDDLRYVDSRLRGTVIRAPDDHPFFVQAIEGRRGAKTFKVLGSRVKNDGNIICYRSDEVKFDSPQLGYTNFDGKAFYLGRSPKRRDWKQGLRCENMFMVLPLNNVGDYQFRLDYRPLIVPFLRKYPSLTEALEKVEDIYDSVAVSQHFSIDNKYNVIYKARSKVGHVRRDDGSVQISSDYTWLTELFEAETGGREVG